MTPAPRPVTLAGGVTLLERAVGYMLGVLPLVSPAAMGRPTPCEDWDLGALLAHMNDSLDALNDAMGLRRVDGRPAGTGSGDLVAGLRGRARELLGALADDNGVLADGRGGASDGGPEAGAGLVHVGGLPVPASLVTGAGAVDIAVHGWDVARACGAAAAIPERLAGDLLGLCLVLVTAADRPDRFGYPMPARPGASASDRLVAYLGRDPA